MNQNCGSRKRRTSARNAAENWQRAISSAVNAVRLCFGKRFLIITYFNGEMWRSAGIYKTSEVAATVGVHPNTVRLYEKSGLIPKPERSANGYRIFTDLHTEQCRLVRIAFRVEILQNGLRKKIIQMIKVSAAGDFDTAFYNPTLYHQCFYWWYYCIQKKPSSHFYEDGEIITVFSSFWTR